MEDSKDHRPSEELLESHHAFPGAYQIKAIGADTGDFVDRVLAAVLIEVSGPEKSTIPCTFPAGSRHVSNHLEINVQSAQQVRDIYARIREISDDAFVIRNM